MTHNSDQVKGNNPLASNDELLTRSDNRSMIHHSDQVNGNNPLTSYDERLTRTDNRVNDPPIFSSQGEQSLGKLLTRIDNTMCQGETLEELR